MSDKHASILAPADALASSVEFLRRLAGAWFATMEGSGMATVVTDPGLPDNPIIYVNAAFTQLTGYSAADVVGRNCRLLQGANTNRQTAARIGVAIRTGSAIKAKILNYRKDGRAFWCEMHLAPIRDETGRLRLFVGNQIDITSGPPLSETEAAFPANPRLDVVRERLRSNLSISGAAAAWEWPVDSQRIVGDAGFATLHAISAIEAAEGISPSRFFSFVHPQDRSRMRLAMGGMFRGAEVLSKQYRIMLLDGTVRWVQVRGRFYDAEFNEPARLSGILIDITEQKRLEEQLRIAQTAGGVGTFEHVDGYGTASVSAQFCKLLGLHPATDLPVRTINAVIHPEDPPLIPLGARPQAGPVQPADFRITRPNTKESRWLTRRGEFLRDAETADFRFSGVIYDITDAKHTEAQLRLLNETLESRVEERTRERDRVWRLSQDLLGVVDTDGRWVSVNPAWKALLGWDGHEIIGKTSDWLQHPDDREATRRELAHLTSGGRTESFESRLCQRQGGYRWLSWTAVHEDGLIYCVGRDITAEKEAAKALADAEEQLRQSQKMEAVGQLTGGLAHDFNNLLTGIAGSLELLQARVAQGRFQELERFITSAQGASKRAAALTHRLLAFSRRQTLDPKPTDVGALIAGLDELVRRTMGPEVAVEVITPPGLWHVLVDPNQLENALLNLCINARDAMPDGGRVTIEPSNQWLNPRTASEYELSPGQYVALCVRDSGVGMPPEVMARAFDPFYTTKPIGQGTGLGLSMIYGFTRQSGGQARIASEVGVGTTVCLYFPRYFGDTELSEAVAELAGAPRAECGETVLVVDDEPTVRMLVSEVLEDLGYRAIEAADGKAAMAVLQSAARLDLLVTDVGLPGGMNGRQVAEAARAARPDLKVLFITGYDENAALTQGHPAPGTYVLTKPFVLDDLASRIKLLLTGV